MTGAGGSAFILCTRTPERFEKYLALNIPHLWSKTSPQLALQFWRFWYQVVLASPLGPWLLKNRPDFVRRVIQGSSPNPQAWSDADVEAFTRPLQEPARARATQLLYRTFLLKEIGPVAAGRYQKIRLTVPTRLALRNGGLRDPEGVFRAGRRTSSPTTSRSSSCRTRATSSPRSGRSS